MKRNYLIYALLMTVFLSSNVTVSYTHLAAELIDSGRALEPLNKLIEVSNRPEAEQ